MSSFTGNRKVNKDLTKSNVDVYANLYSHTPMEINPMPMTTGKMFDVEKDIEADKRIDPSKVFQGYKKSKKKLKKERKHKISRIDKAVVDKKRGVRYGI